MDDDNDHGYDMTPLKCSYLVQKMGDILGYYMVDNKETAEPPRNEPGHMYGISKMWGALVKG